jgi:hypothetical protein
VEAVDILLRVDRFEQPGCIHMGGKRQLDQDAVDFVAGVEGGYQGQKFFRCRSSGGRVHLGINTQFSARLHFAADVNLGSRYFADQYYGKARCIPGGAGCEDLPGNFGFDFRRDSDAVQHARRCGNRCHELRISREPEDVMHEAQNGTFMFDGNRKGLQPLQPRRPHRVLTSIPQLGKSLKGGRQ